MNEQETYWSYRRSLICLGAGILFGCLVGSLSVAGYYRHQLGRTSAIKQELAQRELAIKERERRIAEGTQRIDEILKRDSIKIADTREAVKALADCMRVLHSMYSSGDNNTSSVTTEEIN